jgi:hemoglobin
LAVILIGTSRQAAAQTEKSLYERLGGVFAIAQVVDHFSDALIKNPIVGQNSKNPALRAWHRNSLNRLPGLKFMRTLWVCEVSGGPYKFVPTKPGSTPLGLENAHRDLKISPAEFDEVAAELGRTLDFAKVPGKGEGRSTRSLCSSQERGYGWIHRQVRNLLQRICAGQEGKC